MIVLSVVREVVHALEWAYIWVEFEFDFCLYLECERSNRCRPKEEDDDNLESVATQERSEFVKNERLVLVELL